MKFCCIFPGLKNYDLDKEVGRIPYYLSKEHGYESTIVSFDNDSFTNFQEQKEINLIAIPKKYKINFLNNFLILSYLIKNAKNIDVLNCYHFNNDTIMFFLAYKLINRKGVIYNTLDIEYEYSLLLTGLKKYIKLFIIPLKFKLLFRYIIDLATIESKKTYDVFTQAHPIFQKKIMYMPIYVDPNPSVKYPKKNQIISVGRIGAHQKASEIVLQSFKQVMDKNKSDDWTLKMVGPISEDFKEYINEFFKENPKLKDSIIFTGNIENKNELYKIYSESKIFCLPSRHGSFEIVFVEALYYGNYLIITDVGTGKYLVDISNFGKIAEIDNIEDISNKLIDAIENYDIHYEKNNINFKKLVDNEFGHKKHCSNLNEKLQKIKNKKK